MSEHGSSSAAAAADGYVFGECLWDLLPAGRFMGGAPLNVATHLARLGGRAGLISAVGRDELGDELLAAVRDTGVDVGFVARVGLPTGTVIVRLDECANARYELVQPAAWDAIEVSDDALAAVSLGRALVFGSLAGRAPHNREQLFRLLAIPGPFKLLDVNLRPPFAEPAFALALVGRSDLVKLNDDELGQLVSCARGRDPQVAPPRTLEAIASACRELADATGVGRICVTRGAHGAALYERGELTAASAPAVTVRDTVGAGDAFMAGLTYGLTHEVPAPRALANACRLGAFVASRDGATPLLPAELVALVRAR